MSRLRPRCAISVDGRELTAAEAGLAAVTVRLGLGGSHDSASIVLSPLSPVADTEPGAELVIAFGYDEADTPVLTGTVATVERRAGAVLLEGLAATAALSNIRLSRSYLSTTVGEIAADLLDEAGVAAGRVQATTSLAAFHADARQTAWQHLHRLARLGAVELSTAADGALNLQPPKSGPFPDHTLRYGADLTAWQVGGATAGTPVASAPHGAGSQLGADKWHILLKEPAGAEPSGPTRVLAAVRDRTVADALTQEAEAAARRAERTGELIAVGTAGPRPGDLIAIEDLPGGLGGPVRALAVVHRLDGSRGWRTRIRVGGVA